MDAPAPNFKFYFLVINYTRQSYPPAGGLLPPEWRDPTYSRMQGRATFFPCCLWWKRFGVAEVVRLLAQRETEVWRSRKWLPSIPALQPYFPSWLLGTDFFCPISSLNSSRARPLSPLRLTFHSWFLYSDNSIIVHIVSSIFYSDIKIQK